MGCGRSKVIEPREPTPDPPTPPREPTPEPPTPPREPTPEPPTPPREPTPEPPPRPPSVEFSSDSAPKEIDERTDEHAIEPTEEGYPGPAPPPTASDEVRPKNCWFEDNDFEKGCDEVDLHEIELSSDSIDDTKDLVLKKRKEKIKNKKLPEVVSYEEIDQNAKQTGADLSTKELINHLKRPISRADSNLELLTARAIVVWLASQDIDRTSYGAGDLDSPRGMLQLLKENRMTYATCYTRLCRAANLNCTLVKGLVKAASYEPGKKHAPSTHWTAVYVDGSWQLVHPFWICRALFGHNMGGWVKIEQDGTSIEQREKASQGVVRSTFQENYFMPKPRQFVHECYAEDSQWQLVSEADVVKSEKDFLEMPYLLPPFFGLALELVSEQKCSLKTDNGKCKIVLRAKPWNANMLVLRYELFSRSSTDKKQKDSRSSRMVFNSRANEMFEFDIRFPEPGEYKFIIYGGPYKSPALRLCEFQIICESPMRQFVLLPLSCDEIGWGPGPKSVEAGLLVPTKAAGFVKVPEKAPRRTNIAFQLHPEKMKTNEYNASLHRQSDGEKVDDDRCVDVSIIKRRLEITVTLPNSEEFGLAITCTRIEAGDVVSETTVCNYLLSTLSSRRIPTAVKIARNKLMTSLDETNLRPSDHVTLIWSLIEKCRKQKIDELDEDFCAAKSRFEYLYYKNELRDAVMRDNHDVAVRTLQRLRRYKYRDALEEEIKKVEAMVKNMETPR